MNDEEIYTIEEEENVGGDEGEPEEKTFVYDENAENLVDTFMEHQEGQEAIRAISAMVRDTFRDDWEGAEEWRRRQGEDWKLFTGDLPPKDFPFENCANGHVPIMLENLTRLVARLMGEVYGDWTSVFTVTSIGPEDPSAEAMSIHDNWQLRKEIPDFARQMERSVLAIFTHGDCTCASSYDEARKQNRHEVLTADEFFTPFSFTSTFPDYSDAPHTIRLHFYQRYQLQAMRKKWSNVDDVIKKQPPEWESDPYLELRFETARTQHIEIPDNDRQAPYRILQWEGWDQGLLPNQDHDRYIQVYLDEATGHVLQLSIHEEADELEQGRYEREKFEYDRYIEAMQNHEEAVAGMQEAGATPAGMDVAPNPDLVPPPMPTWMRKAGDRPGRARKKPIYMYVHGTCFENLYGNLGIGYGRVQADFNRAADVTLNQFVDQATIANIPTYIHSDQIQTPRNMRFAPGKFWPIANVDPENVASAFFQLTPGPANPQLMQFVDKVYEWGQTSMQAPSVLSGEAGKSGETWRGMAARIEQATKQLSFIGQKYCNNFLTPVLVNNAKLNSLFLPDYELKEMFDFYRLQNRPIEVRREMWRRNYSVEIRADMRFSTEVQKISEADELAQLPQAFPDLAANKAFMYDLIKGVLTARKRNDLLQDLGQKPPAPPVFGAQPQPAAPAPGQQPGQKPQQQKPALAAVQGGNGKA